MKIELLESREQFSRIFSETFVEYLKYRFSWNGELTWLKGIHSNHNILITNKKLNIIFPSLLPSKLLIPLVREYSYNTIFILNLLQKAYVNLSIKKPIRYWFCNESIKINPWIPEIERLTILPGNHAIRIFEFDEDFCWVFLKKDFSKLFLSKQIKLRLNYPDLPIPKLLDYSDDYLWYSEERVFALPLNRLSNKAIKKEIIDESKFALLDLYSSKSKFIVVKNRLNFLLLALDDAIKNLPSCYDSQEQDKLLELIDWLKIIVLEGKDKKIEIAQTHGDFQAANILVDTNNKNKIYLIDWEYTDQRSIFYDALVFELNARSPKNFGNRLKRLFMSGDNSWQWCFKNSKQKNSLTKWLIGLFLIEDLLVRLVELNINLMIRTDSGLSIWCKEVKQMQWLKYD